MRTSCPACGKALNVPDALAGKRVKCPACGGVIELPAAPAETASEPAPAATPLRPAGPGKAAVARARPSRLRSPGGPAAEEPAEAKKPLWWRLRWIGAIPLVLAIGWMVVALDEKHQGDMAALCRGRAEQTFTANAKDPGLVRFLVGELHQDCLSAAQVEEQVTRRSKRWTYDVDKYLAAMRQRLDREMSDPASALVRRYRAQGR